jgi:hypothetical protein
MEINNTSHDGLLPVDTINFEIWLRFFIAFLMKFDGAAEAIKSIIPLSETTAQLNKRLHDFGKGNSIAFSHLMNACFMNVDARLIASTYNGTWASELMSLLSKRFARTDSKKIQQYVRAFHQMKMKKDEEPAKFVDRVKSLRSIIRRLDTNETPTDLSTITVIKEGLKSQLPILYSVLNVINELTLERLYEEVIKCDEADISNQVNQDDSCGVMLYSSCNNKTTKNQQKFCHRCLGTNHFIRDCIICPRIEEGGKSFRNWKRLSKTFNEYEQSNVKKSKLNGNEF